MSPKARREASRTKRGRQSAAAADPKLADFLAGLHEYEPIEWIRTGIPAIDLIIGAGIPLGRFVEVLGDPSTAKTAFGFSVVAAFQRAGGMTVYIDTEQKADRDFAARFGVDWDKMSYSRGKSLKAVVRILAQIIKTARPKDMVGVFWDSIAGTPGIDEIEEAVSKDGFSNQPGVRARYLSATMRALLNEARKKRVTIIGLNQTRTKLNFAGYTTLESTGGRAIKYHASARVILKRVGRITNRETDVVEGTVIQVETIANTMSAPFRKARLRFLFDTGFEEYSGLDELLLRHGRLTTAGGWLEFRGKKFRAKAIAQFAKENPDLLDPIKGVIEKSVPKSE